MTALGEALLRCSVQAGQSLATAEAFHAHVGGTESNVLSVLAQLGHRTAWASALPAGPLGEMVLRQLRAAGVDVGQVVRKEDSRLGLYFLESALPPAASRVVYDRRHSAFTQLTAADVDADALLATGIFHATGITPALGEEPARLLLELLRGARQRGVTTSFDVNFRSGLWDARTAAAALGPFLAEADIVFCSLRDAATLFGAGTKPEEAAAALRELSPARTLVVTLGEQGAWAAGGAESLRVPAVPVRVIDRPGAGDAFVAGVLHGLLNGDLAAGLHHGTHLASLALGRFGDMLAVSPAELAAAGAPASGGISR